MINNRFLKIQLKRIWIPILVIGIICGGLIGITLTGEYIKPYSYRVGDIGKESGGSYNNALNLTLYYRTILFSFLLVYSLICLIMLLLVEQERGYVGSWLSSPMSRWTIFATKYLAMIIGLLIIQTFTLLLQLILIGALMQDFKEFVGYIFLSHLDILVGVFFIASLMWLLGSIFNRQWIPLLIIAVLLVWFTIATTLGEIGFKGNIKWMENMYYFSLFSLIHTPFERYEGPHDDQLIGALEYTYQWGKILSIKKTDYVWQIPIMTVIGIGSFIGSQFILKNKNYSI